MRLTAPLLGLTVALSAYGYAPNPTQPQPASTLQSVTVDGHQAVAGRLMIRLKSEAVVSTRADRADLGDVPTLATFGQSRGLQSSRPLIQHELDTVARESGLDRDVIVDLAPGTDLKREQAAWAARPEVEWAEFDWVEHALLVPNDQYFSGQWGLRNTGASGYTNDCDIDAELAWDVYTGSNTVKIAIIDTGVDLNHPDLQAKIIAGYDYVNNDSTPDDDHMHGTACASLAAAVTNNTTGMSGVDWNARIMPMKVLDADGFGSDSAIINAINWARTNGANVISMSLGGGGNNSSFNTAVNTAYNAGIPVICATGNDNAGTISYPARYANSFAVGALSPCNQRKSPSSCDGENWGSNYGTGLDVLSPGVMLRSATINGYINNMNGTSGATPQVAGVAALMRGLNPGLTAQQIYDIINDTADDMGTAGWDSQTGWGRLNAYQAVLAASSNPCASDTQAPAVMHTALENTSINNAPYPVTATITDNCTVASANLRFRLNGGSWVSQAMTLAAGVWSSSIPAQVYGTTVNYQIVALDQASNTATVDRTFYVLNPCNLDYTGPTVSLLAPTGDLGSDSTPISVLVDAVDPCGISEVQIGYQVDGGTMLFEAANPAGGNQFLGQLPAQPYGSVVDLSIYAYDNSMNFNEGVVTFSLSIVDPCGSDAVAPLVEVVTPFPASVEAESVASAVITATDPCGLQGATLSCSLNGGPAQLGTVSQNVPGTFHLQLPAQIAAGTLAWTATVSDASPQHNSVQLSGSLTVLPATLLATPQVEISLVGSGQTQLAWPAVSGATGYRVSYAPLQTGPWNLLVDTPNTSVTVTVGADEQWLFRVTAHN